MEPRPSLTIESETWMGEMSTSLRVVIDDPQPHIIGMVMRGFWDAYNSEGAEDE